MQPGPEPAAKTSQPAGPTAPGDGVLSAFQTPVVAEAGIDSEDESEAGTDSEYESEDETRVVGGAMPVIATSSQAPLCSDAEMKTITCARSAMPTASLQ